ncbi:asparaginase domain-containing protein [Bradyrhizobium sp. CCGUVB1N3]|uniref:asparaginase domain-containing protein n=1 Tax=Bradyrhizobium sp. CCGUVB1N3 TaxID=2949629 RepID=UPI0020B410DA|nr:asparaginase domain-containing protein [Bradyrhizobium sp. CCGUVB1N3]MCP3468907.1 asparaginase domain-containing protein [Bradyrhizobium sp. CCGUVB1N3]
MKVDADLAAGLSGERSPEILLIHTGGTIGMRGSADGLTPAAGVLEDAAATLGPPGARLSICSFDPLVDSADIGREHWNRIISHLEGWSGDGAVVTHGTDTMSFTGAALSQSLAGAPFPIILSGAMRPLGTGGDAEPNLQLALQSALTAPPGVWLAFAGRTVAATGLVKRHSRASDSFRSVTPPIDAPQFRPRRFGDIRVAILTISPGMPAGMVSAALAELDGAVLRLFGAGTIVSNDALLDAFDAAIRRGCRLRAVSQCEQGGLTPGAYAAGAPLWRLGVENGDEETAEAALVRLWLELSEALPDHSHARQTRSSRT